VTTLSFDTLNIPEAMQQNLHDLGYKQMTPIQAESLPISLSGKDVIGQAKTGSGKTAAFGLPMLNKINPSYFGIQGLVLCPTRELATQVANELRRLARYKANIKIITLSGGTSIGPQIGSLEFGAHIVVGTPGRILDHLRKKTVDFSHVSTLVFDEADRMLDMGFLDDVNTIIDATGKHQQSLLFSATFPDGVEKMCRKLLPTAERIEIIDNAPKPNIVQRFFDTTAKTKLDDLSSVLAYYNPQHTVIFCNTRQTVQDVTQALRDQGYSALPLQGDMDQRDRDQTLIRFSGRSVSILVATDVAARGLDIDDLELVINFDLPRQTENYVHRIGRTGRAGKSGQAISLVGNSEQFKLDMIAADTQQKLSSEALPDANRDQHTVSKPAMVMLTIDAGKKQKIRPGDVVGAITGTSNIPADALGKITILPFTSYVAVQRAFSKAALQHLASGTIKGKKIKVRLL
jgi:ATP-independent RNA helicase DbpA